MSEKERKKLHGKGIFTVTQLSYTFRPRQIHALDLLDLKLNGTPVYLDVEGLPDRDFYYLIGIRVGTGGGAVQHGFLADNKDGEKHDKQQLEPMLGKIGALPKELGEAETLLADTGYFSAGNVAACEAAAIEPLIAMGRQPHHPPLAERFADSPPAPKTQRRSRPWRIG